MSNSSKRIVFLIQGRAVFAGCEEQPDWNDQFADNGQPVEFSDIYRAIEEMERLRIAVGQYGNRQDDSPLVKISAAIGKMAKAKIELRIVKREIWEEVVEEGNGLELGTRGRL